MKINFDSLMNFVKKFIPSLALKLGYLVMISIVLWWMYAVSFFFIDGMRIQKSCSETGYFTLLSIGTFKCQPVELVGSFNVYKEM